MCRRCHGFHGGANANGTKPGERPGAPTAWPAPSNLSSWLGPRISQWQDEERHESSVLKMKQKYAFHNEKKKENSVPARIEEVDGRFIDKPTYTWESSAELLTRQRSSRPFTRRFFDDQHLTVCLDGVEQPPVAAPPSIASTSRSPYPSATRPDSFHSDFFFFRSGVLVFSAPHCCQIF